ncbi:DNA polymerase IV [Corallococcus sp. bb12-1]|uniref:DNA polymerase IV n=1 Tax=Corallococcus sp. bb12-1 TaxID=2996784 RepID=UPI0022713F43|nr:DNA polymerase IV [Corallococcus sp. bb12-1]MCY1042395.1 DNA polymerase IV [Corallococcus sp. bb12-1]
MQTPPPPDTRILHVDMDTFFASVEELDQPSLKSGPLVIGRSLGGRGVVASTNGVARARGVRSGMPYTLAERLCPQGAFRVPRMARYREVSEQVFAVLKRFSDVVEGLSLDEAWLDVSRCTHTLEDARDLAEKLREAVHARTGLTCSAGVSFNKSLAKMASKKAKPNGVFLVAPEAARDFVDAQGLESIFGLGEASLSRLRSLGVANVPALRECDLAMLQRHFGPRTAQMLHERSRARDSTPVSPRGEPTSASVARTFETDVADREGLFAELTALVQRLSERVDLARVRPRNLSVMITRVDWTRLAQSGSAPSGLADAGGLERLAREVGGELLEKDWGPARLLGLRVSGFAPRAQEPGVGAQLDLFGRPVMS